jgi:predicted metal-binding protein
MKMKQIGIIRCEKNENKCPLTSCLRSLSKKREGFSLYDDCELTGVLTCRCPGDIAVNHAKILKAKGADAIHFCTCTFASKGENGWSIEKGGFCDHIDDLIGKVHQESGLSCVKGSAHLPEGYEIRTWD